MSRLTDNLDSIANKIRLDFQTKDEAREKALPLCREAIRHSGNAIRAVHRQEFDQARDMLSAAQKLLIEVEQNIATYKELRNAGFLWDAQKEFAEGRITLALITGEKLPDPDELLCSGHMVAGKNLGDP